MLLPRLIMLTLGLVVSACNIKNKDRAYQPYQVNKQHSMLTAAELNTQLGLAYLSIGDMQRAKHKLLLAQQQAPESANVQGTMACFLETTGDLQAAEKYYKKAVSLSIEPGAAYTNYGAFLCRRGHYKQAEEYLLKAAQNPNYLNTALAYENAGICAMKASAFEKASLYLNKALLQDPKRATVWLALTKINYWQKQYPAAQACLQHYLALDSNPSPDALWLAIQLAYLAQDTEKAAQYILLLQTKYPNSSEYKTLKNPPQPKSKNRTLYY